MGWDRPLAFGFLAASTVVAFLACGTPPPPDEVPDEVPEEVTCPDVQISAWQEWTLEQLPSGEGRRGTQPGMAMGDLDGDGDLDVLLAFGGGAVLYINDGAGNLEADSSARLGAIAEGGAVSAAVADVDDDGDLDVWFGRAEQPDALLRNDGTGYFEAELLEASEGSPGTGAFGDLDGDGDLDLFVSGFTRGLDLFAVIDGDQVGDETLIYFNEGGQFVLRRSALPDEVRHAICFQGTLLDADEDGDLDVYMGNDYGLSVPPNRLLLNDGEGTFSISESCDCDLEMASMGSGMGDANHDGLPDIYISDFGSPTLLLGQGDGSFVDATMALGADVPLTDDHSTGWGTMFTDLDRDGCTDLVITYGECCHSTDKFIDSPEQYDQVLFGDCGTSFERPEPLLSGFDETGRTRSVGQGDLDRDGRADLVTVGKHFLRTWRVEGGCPGATLQLDAGPGNRQGFGAKVEAVVSGRTLTQWMLPGTASSSSAPEVYIPAHAQEVTVTWPDGSSSTLTEPGPGIHPIVR